MDDHALLEGGSDCPVEAILEVEVAPVLHDMREQVAVERRIIGEQGVQVERALGRDDVREAQLPGSHLRPIPDAEAVLRVGATLTHGLEDHSLSLGGGAQDPALVACDTGPCRDGRAASGEPSGSAPLPRAPEPPTARTRSGRGGYGI